MALFHFVAHSDRVTGVGVIGEHHCAAQRDGELRDNQDCARASLACGTQELDARWCIQICFR